MGADKIFYSEEGLDRQNTIYQAISPFINTMREFKDVEIYEIREYANGGMVDLIQGDLSLNDFEDNLGRSYLSINNALDVCQQIAIYNFLLKMGSDNKYGVDYDFILIDLGPNLGSLNRSVLNASDYIITPMSPDMFSIQATENLGRKMKEWSEEWSDFLKDLDKSKNAILKQSLANLDVNIELPKGKPQFLGYIIQKFTMGPAKNPAVAFKNFMNRFEPAFTESIIGPLSKYDQIALGIKDFNMGEIPDMATAVPTSMEYNYSLKS